jgi:hypothetical protein
MIMRSLGLFAALPIILGDGEGTPKLVAGIGDTLVAPLPLVVPYWNALGSLVRVIDPGCG